MLIKGGVSNRTPPFLYIYFSKYNMQALEFYNNLLGDLEIEKQKCAEDKIKNNAEILKLQDDLIKANKRLVELQTEINFP